MTLIKRTSNLFPEFPTFFDDFFNRDLFDTRLNSFARGTVPAVNVKEEDKGFHIEMAAPGLKKEDFKIELENDVLKISAEFNEENNTEEQGQYSRREFRYASFSRSFRLPENTVDSEKINASYQDGILMIEVPKREEAQPKPARLISIG